MRILCTLKLICAYKLHDKHTACYRDAFSDRVDFLEPCLLLYSIKLLRLQLGKQA